MMRRAIDLALAKMGDTWPNPAVGCVIARDGEVISEAVTASGGRPHAEEQAVPAAGDAAKGATAYVTMEPCGARSSGRTSCSHFLAHAGVARVVVAAVDPSPFASGRGTERLRQAGLEVETGLMCDEGAALCEGAEDILRSWRKGMRPDPDLTVSEWADAHRWLSSSSAGSLLVLCARQSYSLS